MLGQCVPILMLTDLAQLFSNSTPAKSTTERRLMVDMAALREAYNDRAIANSALINSGDNPADGLTKIEANPAILDLLRTHQLSHPIVQYDIERK